MSNRYTVARETEQGPMSFEYPADAMSLQIIQAAGGRSKLSPEDQKRIKIKKVGPGEDCSDMPKSSLEIYLSRGWVVDSEANVETPEPEIVEAEIPEETEIEETAVTEEVSDEIR